VLLLGCGSTVKQGELFEVLVDLRETAGTTWADGYTEGFDCIIPKGSVVKALYAGRPGLEFLEVIPVQVRGNTNEAYINDLFLPPHLKNRDGYQGFSIALRTSYIGTKLKKLE
jgi:hypothetical protein